MSRKVTEPCAGFRVSGDARRGTDGPQQASSVSRGPDDKSHGSGDRSTEAGELAPSRKRQGEAAEPLGVPGACDALSALAACLSSKEPRLPELAARVANVLEESSRTLRNQKNAAGQDNEQKRSSLKINIALTGIEPNPSALASERQAQAPAVDRPAGSELNPTSADAYEGDDLTPNKQDHVGTAGLGPAIEACARVVQHASGVADERIDHYPGKPALKPQDAALTAWLMLDPDLSHPTSKVIPCFRG